MEKDKQKTMENGEKAPVEKLAVDLDDFAFDFDFYHYKDSVEDREQAVEALKEQIDKLTHISNLYYNEPIIELAQSW